MRTPSCWDLKNTFYRTITTVLEGGYMNPTKVTEIFTPERKAILLDILLASGATSITITVSQPHPEKPEDILRKPTLDSIQINANYSTV
jgi:hypothetical protein